RQAIKRLHCFNQGTAHAAGSTENTYFHEYILPLIACPGCFAVQAEPHACTAKHPGQACTAERRESVPICVAQFTRNGRLTTLYRLASFFSMNLRRLRSNLSKLMPDSRQALTSCKRLRAYSTSSASMLNSDFICAASCNWRCARSALVPLSIYSRLLAYS